MKCIGLIVVSFGTSTPELFVNIFDAISGNTEVIFGNVIGSNLLPFSSTTNTMVWRIDCR